MIFHSSSQTAPALFFSNLCATILSLIGSVWMSYSGFKVKPPRNDIVNLILFVALSDVLYAVANLISNTRLENFDAICSVEGFLREFFLVMSVFLAASIAGLAYKTSLDNSQGSFASQRTEPSKFARNCIAVSGAICFILAALYSYIS